MREIYMIKPCYFHEILGFYELRDFYIFDTLFLVSEIKFIGINIGSGSFFYR